MKFLLFMVILITATNCVGLINGQIIDSSINRYNKMKDQVYLGDSEEKVLTLLGPTQKDLTAKRRKPPEMYIDNNGRKITIYYFRSGRQADGLTTDDEFTPYVFVNGRLTSIGWATIGGPKSHGQVVPQTNVTIYK